jgi:hypothetical protein
MSSVHIFLKLLGDRVRIQNGIEDEKKKKARGFGKPFFEVTIILLLL